MKIKGVHYDMGTAFVPGALSRTLWSVADVQRDLRTIRDELHATHVNVYGSIPSRLEQAAALALEAGLAVTIQPR